MLESAVTERYQTTVPNGVRKALSIRPGEDRLEWEIRGDEAIVRRASAVAEEEVDPALEPFLRLLAADIEAHPERLQGMPEALSRSVLELIEGVDSDPDDSFEGSIVL